MPAFWRLDANRGVVPLAAEAALVRRSKHFFNGLLVALSTLVLSPSAGLPARSPDDGTRKGSPAEGESPPLDVAIVQPGAPGSPEAAAGFLRELERYLAKSTGLDTVRASYDNEPRRARETIAAGFRPRSGTGLAIVSPGFYLAERERLGLTAVLEAVPEERFSLVVAADSGLEFADLAGKLVAGGVLFESPRYVERVLFPRRDDEPATASPSTWTAKASTRVSTALYQLGAGKVSAVVLSGRERASLEALGRLKSLAIIRESSYYPAALVVVVSRPDPSGPSPSASTEQEKKSAAAEEAASEIQKDRSSGSVRGQEAGPDRADAAGSDRGQAAGPVRAEAAGSVRAEAAGSVRAEAAGSVDARRERALARAEPRVGALVAAFEGMQRSPEASRLLATMACDGFRRVRGDWLEEVEKRYGSDVETK